MTLPLGGAEAPRSDNPQVAEPLDMSEEDLHAWNRRRKMQEIEYGTYVAKVPIYVGNALAYDVGHPVPVSNVQRWQYDHPSLDMVEKVGPGYPDDVNPNTVEAAKNQMAIATGKAGKAKEILPKDVG